MVVNQTEAVQLAAIRQNVLAIADIYKPTDAVLWEALFRDINVIWRPNQCFTDALQIHFIQNCNRSNLCIPKPST